MTISPTGLAPGAIKHVWLIILENKSYDATFTGLNNNSYLWNTLPSEGAKLTQYYGTGHYSLDNYTSLVSGQGPMQADQNDCPYYQNSTGSVLTNNQVDSGGVPGVTDNGQFAETGSPYASSAQEGTNGGTGCVYPASVPTLFNQYDAANVSWKGYAQDLGNTDATGPTHDVNACGGPGDPYVGTVNPGGANATDQYVPKHFPFPWFDSLVGGPGGTGTDCNSSNIANLDNPSSGLVHDLSANTVPAFSWITPDNCSDAHDAVCAGNNLSGAFDNNGNPVYQPAGLAAYQPEATKPTNNTGGLYASDLFLKYYIPLIMHSQAYQQGGLIDITFDEANPPFANSSFNNANNPSNVGSASYVNPANAAAYAQSDTAGESFTNSTYTSANNFAAEPSGPNSPDLTDANGNQVYPGPGDSAFIDRPTSLSGDPANDPKFVFGGANPTPGAQTDSASAGVNGIAGTNTIADDNVTAPSAGRPISGAGIPANACVGQVTDLGPRFDTVGSGQPKAASNPANKAYMGYFTVVDCTSGQPDELTGNVTSVTFAAETASTDPLYSSTIPTPGGGDTGSVLLSPYITPGTVSNTYYNHYSWLRTMEDLFNVSSGHSATPIVGGNSPSDTWSTGLDGLGHLGFAAQPGLKDFGSDIFTNPGYQAPTSALPETSLAVGLPIVGLLAAGGVFFARRRRQAQVLA